MLINAPSAMQWTVLAQRVSCGCVGVSDGVADGLLVLVDLLMLRMLVRAEVGLSLG